MTRPGRRLTFLLGLWLSAAGAAWASEYRIEMLVFAPVAESSAGDELWTTQVRGHRLRPRPDQPPVSFLAPALVEMAQRLTSEGTYRVLWHHAWTGEALPKAEAPVITLAPRAPAVAAAGETPVGGLDSPELSGYVRFYSGRFLQLELDLSFAPALAYAPAEAPEGIVPGAGPAPRYWLQERRRVKAKSLHYFDHPKFGAIVSIQPLP